MLRALLEHRIQPGPGPRLLGRRPQRRRHRRRPDPGHGRPAPGPVARPGGPRRAARPASCPPPCRWPARGVSVHGNEGLRTVIEEVLPEGRFEDLPGPVPVRGHRRRRRPGGLVLPRPAGRADPGLGGPPRRAAAGRDRRRDATSTAPWSTTCPSPGPSSSARRPIYVLHVGGFDRPRPEPKRPFDMALQAYWIARRARFRRDLAALPDTVEAVLLPTGGRPGHPVQRLQPLGGADLQRLPGHHGPARRAGGGAGAGRAGRRRRRGRRRSLSVLAAASRPGMPHGP